METTSRTSNESIATGAAGGGTGAYVGLRGGGQVVGTAEPDGSGITDVYTRILRIEP